MEVSALPGFSRRKGTIALVLTCYGSLALTVIGGLILMPVYLRFIDARLFGAWLATGSVLTYLSQFDFGLNGVLGQQTAAQYGKKDLHELGLVIGTGLLIAAVLSVLLFGAGVLLSRWVPLLVRINGPQSGELKQAFVLASAGTAMMLMMYGLGGVLTGLQRQFIHGVNVAGANLAGILATVAALFLHKGLVAIAIGVFVYGFCAMTGDGLTLAWFLRKRFKEIRLRFGIRTAKNLSRASLWCFGSRVSNTLGRASDNLIIALLLDPFYCTSYTLTKKASDLIAQMVNTFTGGFLPGLSHLSGEGDRTKFRKISLLLLYAAMIGAVCGFGTYFFFNDAFVSLWVGPRFFGGTFLTGLFLIYGMLLVTTAVFYNVVFAQGELRKITAASFIEVLIRVPLCLVFVRLWGIPGAMIGGILGLAAGGAGILGTGYFSIISAPKKELFQVGFNLVLQTAVVAVMGVIFRLLFRIENAMDFVWVAGGYFVSSFVISLFLNRRMFRSLL